MIDRWDASRRASRSVGPLVTLLVLATLATPARADLEAEAGPVVAAAHADMLATNLVKGIRLVLDRRGDKWIVDRPG